jgi:hypothetical protein
MTTIKTFTIAAALIVGATSLAMAQNGPPTGGTAPVAGGANGGGTTGMMSGKHMSKHRMMHQHRMMHHMKQTQS